MIGKFLVLLVLSYTFELRAENVPIGEYCKAFGGQPGTCMPIENCPELDAINKSPDIPYNVKMIILQGSVCPYPKTGFCCEDEPNDEGIRKLNQTDICGIDNVNSAENSVPWMALLIYEDSAKGKSLTGSFGCVGTLITENFVLTAANCLFLNDRKLIQVRLGDTNYGIEKTIVHERYSNPSEVDNIALVKLAGAVEYKPNIGPICLPFDRSVRDEAFLARNFQTIGWGQNENFEFTNKLMTTSLDRISDFSCTYSRTVRCLRDSQTCVANLGSPLINMYSVNGVERAVQSGIANNFSGRCGTGYPVAYTNLGEFVPWISHKIIEE